MKLCGLQMLPASAAMVMAVLGLLEHGSGVEAGAVTTGVPQNPTVPGGECVRMFHSKGDVGCFSLDKDGSRARLVSVTSADAFHHDKLKENSIVLLPDSLFSTENVAKLNGAFIKGLLVYPTSSSSTSFNYESTHPQGKGTVDGVLNPVFGEYAWNPSGRGVMSASLPYPVVEVASEAKAAEFLELARKNERAPVESTFGVVYRGAMAYYFGPAKMDSISCLSFKNIYGNRSPKCLPVGGQSSWGVKGDLSVSKPVVIAMASMDTNAFSHVYAPGANAGASGLVALLAAADALKTIPSSALKKHIVFAAFQGESYGFVGSRRFLSDIQQAKQMPKGCAAPISASTPFGTSHCASPIRSSLAFADLSLDAIDIAIQVDQVAVADKGFFLHPNNPKTSSSESLVDALVNAPSAKGRVQPSTAASAVPPGPLVSFLNDREFGNASLVSAVLSGYDASFPDNYHSRWDTNTSDTAAAANIAQAAQVLAEALFASSAAVPGSELLASIAVNATLVSSLWTCIRTQWNCPLLQAYSKPAVATMNEYLSFTPASAPSFVEPVTLYTSVYSDNRMPTIRLNKSYAVADLADTKWDDAFKVNLYPNAYETFTRAFLASALRDVDPQAKPCVSNKDCTDNECVYPGVCTARRAYFHDALSPGLKREPTVGLYEVLDKSMPLWTEPNWITLGTFVYPDPGTTIGYVTIGVGVVSAAVGYVLASRFVAHFRKQKLL
ncbi:hypothetical protein DYB26_002709 [Aphanomyces astaci]|uniref:Nicastrin n=4 Tax=Aphanomyces astaci TaxID=112090 RepID=A0A397FKH5_APHAT|nr:hypothetical protein DYB26_002709 [Aphanomyces astaci]RHZ26478.1 hypothetical protein DYB31_001168 [Aphanomyces astaci]